jgi:cyanophycin synthetase
MPAVGGIARQLGGVLTKRLERPGGRAAKLASRAEVLRAGGSRYAWRRVRADRAFAPFKREARNEVYERIWHEAAEAVGASITKLAPDTLEISRASARARVRHQNAGLDDPATLELALDKSRVHRLLADAGVAIPEHLEFDARDPVPALEFLRGSDGPCVVKPAAGSGGGHGTTAGIRTESELMRARRNAARAGARMLIERQASGAVFRLLFLDGELLDVVRSVPGHLTGDGRSSVSDLIFAENERRVAARGAAGVELLGAGLDMVLALERAGLRLSSVVPAGQRIELGDVTNNNSVSDNETFRGALADELLGEAAAAQRAVGLRLAGVDVITADPARPLRACGGVINEVNGTPGLHHHYLVADPERATRVAIPVLERALAGIPHNGARPQGAAPPSPLSRLDPA